jgi:sugar phosphate isomerase/epimerase
VLRLCGLLQDAWESAAERGLALGYHNHWWEFEPLQGRSGFDLLLERADPALFFEVDAYWVQAAGEDPAALLKRLGDRARLLHVKDGPATRDAPMVAVGQGTLDIPAIIAAATGAQALIVELDRCATDMLRAVDESFRYLKGEGLGHGRKG